MKKFISLLVLLFCLTTLFGCSNTPEVFTIDDLKEVAPISYTSINYISGVEFNAKSLYLVTLDDTQCYFVEREEDSWLMTFESDFSKILPFFLVMMK